jgi:hypothetical protein
MAYSPESRKLKYEKKKELMKVDPSFRTEANRKRQIAAKQRVTKKLFDVGFDLSKVNSGVCCFVECKTKLSKYNQDYCCALHQSRVIKNGFYRIMDKENIYGLGLKKEEL